MALCTSTIDPLHAVKYLSKLPKAELHLHLEGTVSPSTLVALSQRHDETPLTMTEVEALYKYVDFVHFLRTFFFVCQRLLTPDDYALISSAMIESLAEQGVKHAEVYVAVGKMIKWQPPQDVMAIFEAMEGVRIEAEARLGISILWIIDANRQDGVGHVEAVFEWACKLRKQFPAVVGVGIGGDEERGPCRWYKTTYAKAKAAGLRLTAHCGESTGPIQGPKEVWDALDMHVERLGHAFCAQYDPDLIEALRKNQVPLELNVTSNWRTAVASTIQDHPFRRYVEAGLMCTINSDDPAMFGSNLLQEYVLVQKEFGFSLAEMKTFAARSFQCSFLSPEKRGEHLALVEAYQGPP